MIPLSIPKHRFDLRSRQETAIWGFVRKGSADLFVSSSYSQKNRVIKSQTGHANRLFKQPADIVEIIYFSHLAGDIGIFRILISALLVAYSTKIILMGTACNKILENTLLHLPVRAGYRCRHSQGGEMLCGRSTAAVDRVEYITAHLLIFCMGYNRGLGFDRPRNIFNFFNNLHGNLFRSSWACVIAKMLKSSV